MGAFLVFFRCWPGFKDPFPFDRFNELPDSDLLKALDKFALAELQTPEVKATMQSQREDFADRAKRQAKRVIGPRTAVQCKPRGSITNHESTLPSICRLGKALGWWSSGVSGQLLPGPKMWFYEAPTLDFAETLVSELEKRRSLDYHKHAVEYHLNPRFGVVKSDELRSHEQAIVRRCIATVQAGELPALPYAEQAQLVGVRSCLVATELALEWPTDDFLPSPDGPVGPDAFCWKGKLYDGLQPIPFRLIESLWTQRHTRREIRSLGLDVWNDHAMSPDANGQDVKSAQKAANAFFKEYGIPFNILKKAGWFILQSSRDEKASK